MRNKPRTHTVSLPIRNETLSRAFLRDGRGRRVHFIGVGGIGMSAVARGFLARGFEVSGSDLRETRIMRELRDAGCAIRIGHVSENVGACGCVVVSTAIDPQNPEYTEAIRQEIPILHRSQALQFLLMDHNTIAVTGTHGKTTTTGMIAQVLIRAGLDPMVVIGGEMSLLGGNFRAGSGSWAVIEADESDRSFLNFQPRIAVVTNIELEHVDHFRNLREVREAFESFLHLVDSEGACFVGTDCPQTKSLFRSSFPQSSLFSYGMNSSADIRMESYSPNGDHSEYRVSTPGGTLGVLRLRVPGEFNAVNSLAALSVGLHVGVPFETIRQALEEFSGVGRRFELKGEAEGVTLLDDYAHHPREVAATLSALEERYSGRRIGIFQPHRYTRTRVFARDFGKALQNLDVLIVTGIYAASETPIPGITGKLVLEYADRPGLETHYVEDVEQVPDFLVREVLRPGDAVVTMGAGSVTHVTERVLSLLRERREVPR